MTIVEKRARVVINSLRGDEAQPAMKEHYTWDAEHTCIKRKVPKSGLKKDARRRVMKRIKARRIELIEQRPDKTPEEINDQLSTEAMFMIREEKDKTVQDSRYVQPILTRRNKKGDMRDSTDFKAKVH